jgi:2-dehydropantoate 2-reductase
MKEGIRMKQKREIRTVSLIGLGAIGCFLASHLGHLLGSDLRVIAGGSRRERLEREGVIVNGVRHHFNIVSPEENCGQNYPDLAIIITKFPALPQALEDMRNQIGPDTLIMAPLNGVEAEDKVAEVFGWDNLLYSLAKVSVVMKDGCASFNPKAARIEMGEKHNETMSPRVQAVKELFERAGIRTVVPEDMERAIWYKYMCNVSENQSAAVLGIPFGAWSVSADANFIREELMREVIAIARKKGISLSERDMEKQASILRDVPPENKPSTLQDIEAGRKTEVEMFGGTIIRMGRELGVPTPYNEMFYHGIKVLEQKNEGLF